eukprot:2408086-Pleurochrysis_carterae.AAC.1
MKTALRACGMRRRGGDAFEMTCAGGGAFPRAAAPARPLAALAASAAPQAAARRKQRERARGSTGRFTHFGAYSLTHPRTLTRRRARTHTRTHALLH